MAKSIRRVSLGTDFSTAIKKAWRGRVCPNCRVEMVEEVDHIQPLHFGGNSEQENSLGLCRSCHGKKSFLENFITNAREASGHVRRWSSLRNPPVVQTSEEINLSKRIARAKRHKNWDLVKRLRAEKTVVFDTDRNKHTM